MKKMIVLLVIAGLVFFNCGKDGNNDSPTGPDNMAGAPVFKTHRITLPTKMQESDDPHAQTVVLYLNLANGYSATLGNNLMPPSLNKPYRTTGDGPWEGSWKKGDVNVQVLIKKLADKHTWEVTFNGSDGTYTFNNFVAFRAEQGLDERNGKFFAYAPNTTLALGQYTWSLDENEALHFEVLASTGLVEGSRFVGTVNDDDSGLLEIYGGETGAYVLLEKYQWETTGAGEWWLYENGAEAGNGTWQ